jgi:hypothetical protein
MSVLGNNGTLPRLRNASPHSPELAISETGFSKRQVDIASPRRRLQIQVDGLSATCRSAPAGPLFNPPIPQFSIAPGMRFTRRLRISATGGRLLKTAVYGKQSGPKTTILVSVEHMDEGVELWRC